MLSLNVVNRQGQPAGTVEIDPEEFGGTVNRQLLHDAVVMYLANQRAGTHSTKRRGEVAGSTKKLFRQKGTGNARVGTRRTNKRRGGGTAKGPKPRDYYYRMPKKAVRLATRMAILSKFQDNEAVVLDELSLPEIRTRVVAETLRALGLEGTSCLIATAAHDPTVYLSARNIDGVEVLPAAELNAYIVLRQKRLLLTRAALDALRQKAKEQTSRKAEPAAAAV
jgi:large subunit ribosomal protein L4